MTTRAPAVLKILPMWLVILSLFILPLSFQAQIIEVSDFFLGNLVTFLGRFRQTDKPRHILDKDS